MSLLTQHLNRYVTELRSGLAALDPAAVTAVIRALLRARRDDRQVLIFGNGGSAALASHMAADLTNTTALPGHTGLRAFALTDNLALLTALANDRGYSEVFARQVEAHCRSGDLCVAVSCSGDSANVLAGVREAKQRGARVVAFTGDQGGELAELADLCVRAPVRTVWQQEDIHLALEHAVAHGVREVIQRAARRGELPPRALVLAAGQGSRLRPLTDTMPKPMVPIAGRPLLEHTVTWLARQGIEEVAINLHHQPEPIVRHFGDGGAFGVRIVYSHEDPLRGTAGAVRGLGSFVDGRPLLVVYGDVLTDLELRPLLTLHHESVCLEDGVRLTMALHPARNPAAEGLATLDDEQRVVRFVEKPSEPEAHGGLASSGILVLEPEVVALIPTDRASDFGHDLLPLLLARGDGIMGWPISADCYLRDIGTPESYERAQREWPPAGSRRRHAAMAPGGVGPGR